MAVSLFTFVDLFSRQLTAADHLLDKGAEHARATGVAPDEMLEWRLHGDMHPLRFQAAVVCNFSCLWTARAAGLEPPPQQDLAAVDLAGLKAAIAKSKAFLAALTPEQFAGRDEIPLTFPIMPGLEPTLPAGHWLSVFATGNIYFHVSTLYGILRSRGVPIGKADFFAGGL